MAEAPQLLPANSWVKHWHEAIGDPTLAVAILHRLVHNAHRLPLVGESKRKRAARLKPLSQTYQV